MEDGSCPGWASHLYRGLSHTQSSPHTLTPMSWEVLLNLNVPLRCDSSSFYWQCLHNPSASNRSLSVCFYPPVATNTNSRQKSVWAVICLSNMTSKTWWWGSLKKDVSSWSTRGKPLGCPVMNQVKTTPERWREFMKRIYQEKLALKSQPILVAKKPYLITPLFL